eukprot:CAMPEP_0171223546 /NCGR_PEP_ID=MMETSP0790-20130122/35834_1 /TAXON_ID=2925 /ORGANISM="Alexandrium catenella, Strain OF101" /LENGTH=58 /DNA_ID=CAMNT_0011689525 /DNA_START=8 /DNA_END=184 /DNA_ORIENTATION=-
MAMVLLVGRRPVPTLSFSGRARLYNCVAAIGGGDCCLERPVTEAANAQKKQGTTWRTG